MEMSLAEAVVKVLAAFEEAEEDRAGGLVARFANCCGLDPVVRP